MSEPIPTPEDPNPPEWPTDPTLPDEDGTPPDVVEPEPTPEPEAQPGWAAYADEAAAEAITQATEIAGRLAPRNMDRAPTAEDGEGLPAGTGWNEYDPATDDLVQMWRWDGTVWARLDMSPEIIPVLDIGSATVGDLTGGRINVTDGPIVAGTAGGARVEMTGDGLHAYDSTGTETARILGDGGEFVGGEFRTSDALPGQVTISDNAFDYGGTTRPGISIEPTVTGYTTNPGIGPSDDGVVISGGATADGYAGVRVSPSTAQMWGAGADGSYAQMRATESGSVIERFGPDGKLLAKVGVVGTQVALVSASSSGTRELYLDSQGIRIFTNASGVTKSYNLEQTAQDSGWQSFPVRSGITASSDLAWRNKGGIIWFRGHVWSGTWAVGAWSDIVTGLDSSLWPSASRVAPAPHSSVSNLRLQITSDGTLQVWVPANAGTTSITVEMDALHYPTG